MSRHLSFIALLPLTFLLACGGAPSPAVPIANTPNYSGNWDAASRSTSSASYDAAANFFGSLSVSNGIVAGNFTSTVYEYGKFIGGDALDVSCPGANQPVTGTIDGDNKLSINVPVSGGIATITGTLAENPQTIINGSYSITGGQCAIPATPINIAQYAPVTGTYSGTLSLTDSVTGALLPGTSSTVTAVLTQSTMLDSFYGFPAAGTVTVTGACNDTMQVAGFNEGDGISLLSSSNPSAGGLGLLLDPSAATLTAYFNDSGSTNPNCSKSSSGTLTRQ